MTTEFARCKCRTNRPGPFDVGPGVSDKPWGDIATMKRKVLITGATGDTGHAAIKESIRRGLDVRAMIHVKDDRSAALEKLGADIVIGDLHQIDTIRHAMEGTDAAYFVYPVQPGLIEATVNFAQAAKEAAVAAVVNDLPIAPPSATPAAIAGSQNRSSTGRACLSPIFAPPTSSSGCSTLGSFPSSAKRASFACRSATAATHPSPQKTSDVSWPHSSRTPPNTPGKPTRSSVPWR
jgi:hypothetical protein